MINTKSQFNVEKQEDYHFEVILDNKLWFAFDAKSAHVEEIEGDLVVRNKKEDVVVGFFPKNKWVGFIIRHKTEGAGFMFKGEKNS